jgi:CrcB protein
MSSPRRPAGPRWVPSGAVGLLVGRRRNAVGVDGRRRPRGPDDRSDEPVKADPNAYLAHPEPVDPDLLDADVEDRIEGPRKTRPAWLRLPVLAAVAAGGVLGAPARYELALALPARSGSFPLSTFVINVTGSLVLGALLTLIVEKWPPTEYLRPFAATGVLGAYTTWSTFMVDTDMLLKAGHVLLAVGYVAATLSAGLAAVYLGILLVRTWPPPLLGRRSTRGDDDDSGRDR